MASSKSIRFKVSVLLAIPLTSLVALWGFASFRFDAGPGAIALLGLAWALPPVLLGPLAGRVIGGDDMPC